MILWKTIGIHWSISSLRRCSSWHQRAVAFGLGKSISNFAVENHFARNYPCNELSYNYQTDRHINYLVFFYAKARLGFSFGIEDIIIDIKSFFQERFNIWHKGRYILHISNDLICLHLFKISCKYLFVIVLNQESLYNKTQQKLQEKLHTNKLTLPTYLLYTRTKTDFKTTVIPCRKYNIYT